MLVALERMLAIFVFSFADFLTVYGERVPQEMLVARLEQKDDKAPLKSYTRVLHARYGNGDSRRVIIIIVLS